MSLSLSGTAGVTYPDGSVAAVAVPTGSVVQVVQTTLNTSGSTSSTSYVDVAGMSVSITPSSASNKILVFAYINLSNNGQNGSFMRVLRNSTNLLVGTGANAGNDGAGITTAAASGFVPVGANGYTVVPCMLNYLDSPSTTSAVTYKIQVRTGNTQNCYWNSNAGNSGTTNSDFGWFASTITVMEIKA